MNIAMTSQKIITFTLTLLIVLSSMNAYAGQWDGFFFGVNAGVAQSNAKDETGPDDTSSPTAWAAWRTEAPNMWANGGREKSNVSPLVGVSAAYNRQIDSFVFGVELGLNALDAAFAHDGTHPYVVNPILHYTYRQQTRLDGLITLRGRAGVAFGDSLVSVTGGLAATQLKTSLGYASSIGAARFTATRTKRDTALGPTVGLAYEHMLPDDFVVKAEFTYVDFGKTRFSTPVFNGDGRHLGDMGFTSVQHLSIFTLGLEKKF